MKKCLKCGIQEELTKHHVYPSSLRKYIRNEEKLDAEQKLKTSIDIKTKKKLVQLLADIKNQKSIIEKKTICLCRTCHTKYHSSSGESLKIAIVKLYAGDEHIQQQIVKRNISRAQSILENKTKPVNVLEKLKIISNDLNIPIEQVDLNEIARAKRIDCYQIAFGKLSTKKIDELWHQNFNDWLNDGIGKLEKLSKHIVNWNDVGLGTRPDLVIAKELGVDARYVGQHRKRLMIHAYEKPKPKIDWKNVGLGTKTDADIAKELKVLISSVRKHRMKLNIPNCKRKKMKKKIDWTKVGLGTKTDFDIAKELHTSCSVVFKKRTELKIKPFGKQKTRISKLGIDWSKAGLGTDVDKNIARKLNVAVSTVNKHRIKLNIPKYKPSGVDGEYIPSNAKAKIDWGNVGLGTDIDKNIAKKLNVSVPTVQAHRIKLNIPKYSLKTNGKQINWDDIKLGKSTDVVIAKELGVQAVFVSEEREKRNIPVYDKLAYIDWNNVGLGTKIDVEIANKLKVSKATISRKRDELNIPAYNGVSLLDWTQVNFDIKTNVEIAKELNVDVTTVRRYREKYGNPQQEKIKVSKINKDVPNGSLILSIENFLVLIGKNANFVNEYQNQIIIK